MTTCEGTKTAGWLDNVRNWWRRPRRAPSPSPPSPYRDSLQLGVSFAETFTPDAWGSEAMRGSFAKDKEERRIVELSTGAALTAQLKAEFDHGWSLIEITPPPPRRVPVMQGKTRAFVSLRPEKLILDEDLIFTFTNADKGTVHMAACIEPAGDLVLASAFVGNLNCFPVPPDCTNGIGGQALSARSIGTGIRWPVVNSGLDVCIGIAVKPTVLYRIDPPPGYTRKDLSLIQINARLNIFGPSLAQGAVSC